VLDGRDITPLMFDPQASPVRDTHLYFTANQTVAAIRQGDWKLFLTNPAANKKKDRAAKSAQSETVRSGPLLYNLATDPGETTDVAAEHPELVARLKADAARREAEIKEHRRPAGQLSSTN
jgi:arylsulfatase A-like enzyme